MKTVFVTGGLGYIGSHTVVELIQEGHKVVILDNLSNASFCVLDRLQKITGARPVFYPGDVRDATLLDTIFADHRIDSVVHFAALKAVGESVAKPLLYYNNNVAGSLTLLQSMQKANLKNIVFSSSATVYGDPECVPVCEDAPTGNTTNPYGETKRVVERLLIDLQRACPDWSVTLLRYFNPIGAHPSGEIGEHPSGIPNNLLPYLCQVAAKKLPYLSVFGDDYPTCDGTGVRDYIHVVDLAKGHALALKQKSGQSGVHIYNLGAGVGYSVLQIVKAFEQATGQTLPYQIKPRRSGDVAVCYANPQKAEREISWKAERDLLEAMKDTWRWLQKNPNGYETAKET